MSRRDKRDRRLRRRCELDSKPDQEVDAPDPTPLSPDLMRAWDRMNADADRQADVVRWRAVWGL